MNLQSRLNGWLRSWRSDNFIRSVATLSSGLAVSQVILILAAPVLTRLYTPDEMGVLSAFAAGLSILLIISCWRYERAIPIAPSRRIAIVILWLSGVVLICNVLVVSVCLFWFQSQIAGLLSIEQTSYYLWFLPVGLIFAGTYELLTFTAVRDLNYSILAKTKIYQGAGQIGTQVGLGVMGGGAAGLIIGYIIGQSFGMTNLLRGLKNQWKARPRRYYLAHLKIIARRYWQFPVYSTPAGVLNRAATMAPPLLFIAFYDTQVAGFLYLAQHVILGPLAFIGRSVAKVFLGHAGNGYRTGTVNIPRLVDTTLVRLLLVGALPIGFIAIFGPVLFGWIFGEQWIESGYYARYLAVALWMQFAMGPLLQTLIVLEKQGRQVIFDSIRLVLVMGIIVVMSTIIHSSARQTIIGYSIALAFSYMIGYAIVRMTAKMS